MSDTAEKIMELFRKHDKVKTGLVLTATELSFKSSDWEPSDFSRLDSALEELSSAGYIIVTPSLGLELTDKGYSFLFDEI